MERDETGQYQAKVPEEDVIDAVEQHSPAGTAEVAKTLGVSRQAADYRLRNLREQGRIESKKIGPSLVWTVAAESDPNTAASDAESDTTPDVTLPDDVPESVDQTAAQTAIQAAFEYVRESGPVERRAIVNAIMPDHSLGYTTDDLPLGSGEETRGSWWRRVVRPGLKANGVTYWNGNGWAIEEDA